MTNELKKLRLVVEMTVPAHYQLARTAAILQQRLSEIYPKREVAVHEYNRVAAAAHARTRRVARGLSNEELLAQIETLARPTHALPTGPAPAIKDDTYRQRLAAGTPLDVPFEERSDAKSLGARFDAIRRRWVVLAGDDLAPFLSRWPVCAPSTTPLPDPPPHP